MRLLGITSRARVPGFPALPTMAEACGLPGFETRTWCALAAPAAATHAVIARLAEAERGIIDAPDFAAWVKEQGMTPMREGPAEACALLAADLPKWAEVVRRSGARVD